MAGKSNHALVFGASGNVGWGVVDQLLSNYPAPGIFSQVTALVNRPLKLEDSCWPIGQATSPELQLVSGVNLVEGTVESIADLLRSKVKDIENVTHVFYFGTRHHHLYAYLPQQIRKCSELIITTSL